MGQDRAEDRWDRIKGREKRGWGYFSEDDFKEAEEPEEEFWDLFEQEKRGDRREADQGQLERLSLNVVPDGRSE